MFSFAAKVNIWQELTSPGIMCRIYVYFCCLSALRMKFIRNIPIILLTLLVPFSSFSQDQKKKKEKKPREKDYLSLEFNLDYSFVLGNYGAVDKTTYKSGFAANGWVAQLGFNWLGKNGFGLGLQYDLQHNPYKDTAKSTIPYGTKYPLGSAGWTNNYLLAGLACIKDFGKWELNVKALVGFIFAQSTNFNVLSPIDQSNVAVNATGFAYSFYVGVGYRFSEHWGMNLNVNYLGATPKATKSYGSEIVEWKTVRDTITGTTYNVAVYSAPVKYEIKRTVSTFNGGIGVIYHF